MKLANESVPIVNGILRDLLPDVKPITGTFLRDHIAALPTVRRAVDLPGKLNEFTQRRIGRHDISDRALMCEAFKPEPSERGKPRLRCPGNPETEIVRSMQAGAQLFAMGAFQAIRNPAIHWTGLGNPAMAAEQLAALSIVARWVRHWDVVRYVEPINFGLVEVTPQPRPEPGGKTESAKK